MAREYFDYDPFTGVKEWFHSAGDGKGGFYIEYEQPALKSIIENNKRLQNHDAGGAKGHNEIWRKGVKNGMVLVGRIPNWVILKWKIEKGIDALKKEHAPAVARLLDDPEWRWLRIGTGKIGKQSRWI